MEQSPAKTTITFNHQIIPDFIGITNSIKQNSVYSFGRKAMKKLDSILKSRDITLSTMMHIVIAMVSPVFMYVWM